MLTKKINYSQNTIIKLVNQFIELKSLTSIKNKTWLAKGMCFALCMLYAINPQLLKLMIKVLYQYGKNQFNDTILNKEIIINKEKYSYKKIIELLIMIGHTLQNLQNFFHNINDIIEETDNTNNQIHDGYNDYQINYAIYKLNKLLSSNNKIQNITTIKKQGANSISGAFTKKKSVNLIIEIFNQGISDIYISNMRHRMVIKKYDDHTIYFYDSNNPQFSIKKNNVEDLVNMLFTIQYNNGLSIFTINQAETKQDQPTINLKIDIFHLKIKHNSPKIANYLFTEQISDNKLPALAHSTGMIYILMNPNLALADEILTKTEQKRAFHQKLLLNNVFKPENDFRNIYYMGKLLSSNWERKKQLIKILKQQPDAIKRITYFINNNLPKKEYYQPFITLYSNAHADIAIVLALIFKLSINKDYDHDINDIINLFIANEKIDKAIWFVKAIALINNQLLYNLITKFSNSKKLTNFLNNDNYQIPLSIHTKISQYIFNQPSSIKQISLLEKLPNSSIYQVKLLYKKKLNNLIKIKKATLNDNLDDNFNDLKKVSKLFYSLRNLDNKPIFISSGYKPILATIDLFYCYLKLLNANDGYKKFSLWSWYHEAKEINPENLSEITINFINSITINQTSQQINTTTKYWMKKIIDGSGSISNLRKAFQMAKFKEQRIDDYLNINQQSSSKVNYSMLLPN